jgi:membrane-associated phospholipid phosphatase
MAFSEMTSSSIRKGPVFGFLLTLSVTASGALPLAAQTADTTAWRIPSGQVASAAAGLSLALVPTVFNINDGLPTCAPCDPATLPGIDRWATSTENSGWGVASSIGEIGLAAGTWYELYKLPNGNRHVAVSVEAAAWNLGVTILAKALFNRNRPVLYTEDAIVARESLNSHRSMYSGHTSTAFVLATSYFLSMSHKKGLGRYWPLIAATGVGVMRVAAGKHFPTDVFVGAAVGSGTAIVLHQIRF